VRVSVQIRRKFEPFVWTAEQQSALEDLKGCLISPPVLALSVDTGEYVLNTDRSDFAVSAVLQQAQDSTIRVIAYAIVAR
jgi:RNase H-like domain found in reverse transcriptase